jgi:hypothetical protein
LTWLEVPSNRKLKEVTKVKKTLSLALLAIVLVVSLGIVPVAFADNTSADINANGIGKLEAHGDGIAILYGKGTVELSGNGTLWIKDNAGDAKIEVTGYGVKKDFPDGWIQYSGMHGTASVKGTSIRVVISGVDINLTAKGRGGAILWGHGTYAINGRTGQWGANTVSQPLTIAPAQ